MLDSHAIKRPLEGGRNTTIIREIGRGIIRQQHFATRKRMEGRRRRGGPAGPGGGGGGGRADRDKERVLWILTSRHPHSDISK